MTLTFGKHKGEDITDVPYSYLEWLEQQKWINPSLREAIIYEFSRRANPSLGKVIKKAEPK